MASITIPVHQETHPNLRPLNVLRDLPHVADLIELCFSSTMDSEGQRYIQDMRRAGHDASFLKWAHRTADSTSLPLTGYVWEENGLIVGNASLVPFRHQRRKIYLIANVAVHPTFRRRGIAKALTQRALLHARQKRISATWLHVRDDNPGAVKLYSNLGFVEKARRTTWQSSGDVHTPDLKHGISITRRDPRWWPIQQKWLARFYPDLLAWHRPWNFNALRPGLWGFVYMLLVDVNIRQWAAVRRNVPEAMLAWIPTGGRSESLFLTAGESSGLDAVTALLLHARRALSYQRHLSLEFPAGEFDEAIQNAGFNPQRTLIWMKATS